MEDDVLSAIDDSGATQVFGRPPPLPRSEAGSGPITFEYGRRSGHWTAADTVFGSAIDDGCPIVIQLPRPSRAGDQSGHVHPLSTAALKKLKNATEEDEKKKAAARVEVEAREQAKADAAANAAATQEKAASSVHAKPKGFYTPKQGMGIRIVGKDGKNDVILQPRPVAKSGPTTTRAEPESKARPSAPEPTVKPDSNPKAASAVFNAASSVRRKIKIVGKNGEEAFVELPAMQVASHKLSSVVYVPAVSGAVNSSKGGKAKGTPPVKKESKEDKAARERKAAQAAKELRAQRERQEKEEKEQRERQAKAVADILMSGGFLRSRDPSEAKSASARTVKSTSTRSASVLNGIFDTTSKPLSKVSSRTMTPPPAQVPSVSAASTPAGKMPKANANRTKQTSLKAGGQKLSSKGSAQAKQRQEVVAAAPSPGHSNGDVGQQLKTPSQQDWQAMGSGIVGPRQKSQQDFWEGKDAIYKTPSAAVRPPPQPPPAPQAEQQRRKASTPPSAKSSEAASRPASITSSQIDRKVAGIRQWNDSTPSVLSRLPPVQENSVQNTLPPIDTHRANNMAQETIFAGTGWISPHPLSIAPSEFEPPPQDHISIRGETMTYTDWKNLQNRAPGAKGGRNFSRTSSEGRTLSPGTWDQSALDAGVADAGKGSAASERDGGGWATNYHVPTVMGEHSHRSHQSYHSRRTTSLSHVPRAHSVRIGNQLSGRSAEGQNRPTSFNDAPPAVGFWAEQPQVDGVEPLLGREERSWREPERWVSPVSVRSLENGAFRGGNGLGRGWGETVHLRMPWDKEALVGDQVDGR